MGLRKIQARALLIISYYSYCYGNYLLGGDLMEVMIGDLICASFKKHKEWAKKKINIHRDDTLIISAIYTFNDKESSLLWSDVSGCYAGDLK